MTTPQAIMIGAGIIAAAVYATGQRAEAQRGGPYQISANGQFYGAWRVNTATGDVSACGLTGCQRIAEK